MGHLGGSSFVQHFQLASFGLDDLPEAPVAPVDGQHEALIVLPDRETGGTDLLRDRLTELSCVVGHME